MLEELGAGFERNWPLSESAARRIEPLGIVYGGEAQAAVTAGAARWLAGGPLAFALIRFEGRVLALSDIPPTLSQEVEHLSAPLSDWAGLGAGPLIMGILNVTPDSFSDGGDHLDPGIAIAAGERMLSAGVDVLDVGGESTRPGSQPIAPELEQTRVLPVIQALARQGAVLSIDSRNAGTMERALDAGAGIVNDVSSLAHDTGALPLVAARGCPVILMHMRGSPATMNTLTDYDEVAVDVKRELAARIAAAEAGGVDPANIAVDPGFGFAKTAIHNIELLRRLPMLLALGCPIVVGASRKSTVSKLAGETDPKALGPGSIAAALFALSRSARIVRVHDAIETVQAVRVWRGLTEA